jgi:hypothetical protein
MRPTILVALAAAAGAASLPSQQWNKLVPPTSPTARRAGAMAFDGTANRLILYGGTTQTPAAILGETWSWNGITWTLLNPPGGAPPRWGHRIVRDTQLNRLLTFGGRSPTISGLASDTYQWSGTAWSLVPAPTAPPARFRYGMVYDSVRSRLVLFGGRTLSGNVADMWEFDGATWIEVTTANSPPPREDMVFAFDSALNRTVLFGGYDADTNTLLGDTWEYDGLDWQEITPIASPSPRFRAASCFDTTRKRIVIYGGYGDDALLTETWEYAGSNWLQVSVGAGSPLTTEAYAAFDSQRSKFVTFGGVGTEFGNQTWEFTGANTGIFGMFGEACETSAGICEATAQTTPRVGQNLVLDWTNLPPATATVLLAQGFSNTQWNGIPLPLELSLIGLVGCYLHVAPELFTGEPVVTPGVLTTTTAIPNDPSLVNMPFYSQLIVPDTAAVNGVGGTSRAARSIFGS